MKGQFRAENNTDSDVIYLYDMIVESDAEAEWWGGVSPQKFIETLNKMKAETIHLRVNSPGGSVFAARAIEQAIKDHPSTIIAHVDGYAASAASFLIMAADRIEMAEGAFLMIHKAWTYAWGNSDDLVQTAGLLEQIDASLVKTYEKRTKQTAEDISTWMNEETWFDSARAVELGFADVISSEQSAQSSWNMSAYKKAPKLPENIAQAADRDALLRAALLKIIPA